jgi:hypothetical protein
MFSTHRRISRVFYFEGISFGLLLGSLMFFVYEIGTRIAENGDLLSSPAFVVVPAFLAAYITLRAIGEQARLAQDFEYEKYERAERASRADLPLALSELTFPIRFLTGILTPLLSCQPGNLFPICSRDLRDALNIPRRRMPKGY